MKQEFDRLEEFRRAINFEAKLYCNVDEAYTKEKAAELLHRLMKSWKMNEDNVITVTTQRVCDTIDIQLRNYVLQFANAMGIPFDAAKIKQRWEMLSAKDKNEAVDGVISYLQEHNGRG